MNWVLILLLFRCTVQLVRSQSQCQVIHPSGWETGLDNSGVRTRAKIGTVDLGTNVSYRCPDSKVSAKDGRRSWTGACLEKLKGYGSFEYDWPGSSWPECECPTNITCKMPGAESGSVYSTRYAYEVTAGESPGMDLSIPLPQDQNILFWKVKITWDMLTKDQGIIITSRTKGVDMERLDFQGHQHEFKPIKSSSHFGQTLNLDVQFNFDSKEIRADSKKWHYPCIAELKCDTEVETEVNYVALAIVMGSVVAVVFLCGCCCATCTWCLKQDSAYGGGRLMSAYSIRTVREPLKVRPYSG